jgi:putative transposase
MVTSNHIHLLVQDTGNQAIPRSMQLIAGRVGQAYNQRKVRKGAFWEDRYHATAVDTDEHLARCLTYIDMNMVRAGVVKHPRDWLAGGYHEIQTPSQRYGIVDLQALLYLLEISSLSELQQRHLSWIDEAIQHDKAQYNAMWSNCIAVGNEAFVEEVKSQLALIAKYRDIHAKDDTFLLREADGAYTANFVGETDVLSAK